VHREDQTPALRRYLKRGHLAPTTEVSFLARGENSLNYRVGEGLVARLVTNSEMGLPLREQALYEHHALTLLAPSGVTPEPSHVDPEPEGLPYPLILEQYLPGRPLDYATDLQAAARCVASVHALGVPRGHGLQEKPDPAPAILSESRDLAEPYLSWPDAGEESKAALRAGFEKVEDFLETGDLFADATQAVVNYDLNTHNFVVETGEARLLDWEKARIAPAVQDVAHFLLPTTTLWRDDTATRLTRAQEEAFVATYLDHAGLSDRDRFLHQLDAMKVIVSLRAVSWCAWALAETARGTRAIVNEETLNKGRSYLEPDFLVQLFGL
jgi:thiamine kinase-like enzyme